MGHTGPSQPVTALMATEPTYGLIRSAAKPPPEELADLHWQNGITYEPEGCLSGITQDPCAPTDVDYLTGPSPVDWVPYGLTYALNCTTFSYRAERVARTNRGLRMDQERQLGFELWTGSLASLSTLPDASPWPNTWLADSADTAYQLLSGAALSPADALACLEGYLGSHNGGQEGMIHMSPHAFTYFAKDNMLKEVDGIWRTNLGHVVVASPGYPGTGPDGTVGDNNVWVYATDMVRVWLGPIQDEDPQDSTDREQNNMQTLSWRVGLAEWERCRHAAAQLAIPYCEGETT
jgi:hypothetical protein